MKLLTAIAISIAVMCGPAAAQSYFSPGHEKKQDQVLPNFDLMPWFKKSVEDSPDIARPGNVFVAVCTDMTLRATIAAPHEVKSVLFIVNSHAPQERLVGVAGAAGEWTVDWVMPCTKTEHNYKVLIEAVDARGEYAVAVQWIFLRR
jgi:hypothetical protein